MTSVLLVDDERDLLSLVDFNLRAAGFETFLAATGEQARAQLRRELLETVRGIGYRLVKPAEKG